MADDHIGIDCESSAGRQFMAHLSNDGDKQQEDIYETVVLPIAWGKGHQPLWQAR